MGIADLININNIQGIDSTPVSRDSAGVVEVTGLAVQNALDNFNTNSSSNVKNEFLYKQQQQIEERTGKSLFDLIGEDARRDQVKRAEMTDQLLDQDPDLFQGVPRTAEVLEQAREQARVTSEELRQATLNANPFSATAGSLVGTLGGAAADPVNLALLPFGAGAGKSVLQAVLIEAGLNAGAEILTQPRIASWQREIGNEYGFGDAVSNVGMAALLGAGFTGIARGVKPTASAVFEFISKSENIPSTLANQIKQLADYAHLKEKSPFENVNGPNFDVHIENMNAVSRAFEARKSIDDVPINTSGYKQEFLEEQISKDIRLLARKRQDSDIPALFSSSSLTRLDLNTQKTNLFDTASSVPFRSDPSISVGRLSSDQSYTVYQPVKDVSNLITMAEQARADLVSFTKEVTKGINTKGKLETKVKLKSDLQSLDNPDSSKDILRSTIRVTDEESLKSISNNIQSRSKVIEIENNTNTQEPHINMMVSSKNGLSAQIRINLEKPKTFKKFLGRQTQRKVDVESFTRPLVADVRPRTTPADVESDVNVTALSSAEKLRKAALPDVLDDAEVQRIRDADMTELKRLNELDSNFKFEFDDDDIIELFGNKRAVTSQDIIDTIEADENLLDAVRTCAIG